MIIKPVLATSLGTLEGLGPLGKVGSKDQAVTRFNEVVSLVIGFLTVVAGLWFVFQFLSGAIGWLSAGGDKAKLQAAQGRITQAIIGLAVVIAAIFIIDLVGTLLGLNILSPGDYILSIWP
jgi:hypothetical protein